MSETTFPFAEDGADMESDQASRKRTMVMVAAVGAALLLAVAGYFFLGSGDSSDTGFTPLTRHRAAAVPAVKPAAPAHKLPVAYKQHLGRDPFVALIQPAVAVAAASAAPAPAAAPPAATSSGTSTSTTTVPASAPYTVKLVSIVGDAKSGRIANWVVDGTAKSTLLGQRFGKYGELVGLAFEQNSAGKAIGVLIQVGDDSPMEILVGAKATVL